MSYSVFCHETSADTLQKGVPIAFFQLKIQEGSVSYYKSPMQETKKHLFLEYCATLITGVFNVTVQ